jgi:hypothetical protein
MSKASAPDGQFAQARGRLMWPEAVCDDDDDDANDETDVEEEDEPSVGQQDRWSAHPGFGSPEWWSGI